MKKVIKKLNKTLSVLLAAAMIVGLTNSNATTTNIENQIMAKLSNDYAVSVVIPSKGKTDATTSAAGSVNFTVTITKGAGNTRDEIVFDYSLTIPKLQTPATP